MDSSFLPQDTELARQRSLNEQAAAWLLTLEDEYTSEAEARFRRWLESSANHIQAFLEVAAVDLELDSIDSQRHIDLEALIADIHAEGESKIIALQEPARAAAPPAPTNRWPRSAGIAAGAAALAILGGAVWWSKLAHNPSYITAIGEQRAFKLEDGSLMHLNTRSRAAVDFTEQARDIQLLEGEALFTVERDSKRPFRVLTSAAVVQAIGTQFNVYQHDGATKVSVVEGRVRISANHATRGSTSAPLTLTAGEEASIDDTGRVARRTAAKVSKTIAWRQRQLDFDHAPLADVVEQFNRYNRTQIHIADPAVRLRELDGVFNADQPQALLDFLVQERQLWIEHSGDVVIIHARPPHDPTDPKGG